jgi:3-hydroxy-9,10-secoandrosta-1,3,5(10)-triene-9,17-dione monooxygenase reductase component
MIHPEHPFWPDVEARDPVRRLRGRLAAPVTIITAGASDSRSGLTVSVVALVEGEPSLFYAFVGPTSDLWTAVADRGRFVVHVLGSEHAVLSDVFAGTRPSPGGLFATSVTIDSEWGPVLSDVPDRAFCTRVAQEEVGYSGLIVGTVDRVELSGLSSPLVYFRGRYHQLEADAR